MPVTESTHSRLVLKSGSSTLTLDKNSATATFQRKLLFWKLKPLKTPLSEMVSVAVDKMVDRASSVEIYNTMLVTRAGAAWAVRANDHAEAKKDAEAVRAFLGLK